MKENTERKNNIFLYICSLIYIAVAFIIFPLIIHNGLFDVSRTKYYFFITFSFIFVWICLVYTIISKSYKIMFRLSVYNICLLSFLLINIISFVCSSYKNISLYGSSGRMFGLITIISICLSCFFISRLFVITEKHIFIICTGSCLVAVIGILNFCGIDPFRIYTRMVSYQRDAFIGTIGHCNIYSSFFSLTFPICFIMSINSCKNRFFYFACTIINFMAMLSANSDSIYISSLVCFIAAFFYTDSKNKAAKMFCMMIILILVAKLYGIIYLITGNNRLVDSLTAFIMFNPFVYIVCGILGLALIFLMLYHGSHYKIIICTACIFAAVSGIFFLYKFVNADMFHFNDHWGNNRGFIWKTCLSLFNRHYSTKDLLFGCGPDCIKPLIEKYYLSDIVFGRFETFNNAHNELIQYLLVNGIFGVLSYIGILSSTICKFNHNNKTPVTISLFAAMLCYFAQSLFNINQIMTTPLFFIIVALNNTDG